jgi:membrane protein implicated in regulation of membrane protease activity
MGGKLRPFALITGLAGACLTGYALFTLLASAGCIPGFKDAACPAPILSPFVALPLGIVLATAGMMMGGGMIVFAALFLAIGLAALAVGALGLMPDMPAFPWLFGGMFFAAGLLPLFGGLAMKRLRAGKQVMAAELMRSGTRGIGTIVEVGDTGVTVNNNPRIRIRMRIEPLDGSAPVERSKTMLVSRVALPRAGDRFPAWFDPADPDKWMYGTDMEPDAPPEIKDLFARAHAGGGSATPAPADSDDGPVAELTRLSELWKSGALSDAEFADAKARLLPLIGT